MSEKQPELRGCPFCGGEAWLFPSDYSDGLKLWNVRCRNCNVAFDDGNRKPDEAIAAWNRRAPQEPTDGPE